MNYWPVIPAVLLLGLVICFACWIYDWFFPATTEDEEQHEMVPANFEEPDRVDA